ATPSGNSASARRPAPFVAASGSQAGSARAARPTRRQRASAGHRGSDRDWRLGPLMLIALTYARGIPLSTRVSGAAVDGEAGDRDQRPPVLRVGHAGQGLDRLVGGFACALLGVTQRAGGLDDGADVVEALEPAGLDGGPDHAPLALAGPRHGVDQGQRHLALGEVV